MHASNLLKAVLKPRALSTNSGMKQSLVTPQNDVSTKGKHNISSLDHSLPSASVIARKSSRSSSPPVKVACLCSPTNHPGSFRCRLHRTGKPLGSASASSSKASGSSRAPAAAHSRQAEHMIGASGMHKLTSLPGPPPSSLARSPLGRTSRLNTMVASAHSEGRDSVNPCVNEEPVRISSTAVNNGNGSFMPPSATLCMADSVTHKPVYMYFAGSRGGGDGDWTCPQCGNVNFSFRTTCNMRKCGTAKPSEPTQSTSKKATDAYVDRSTTRRIYVTSPAFSY